MPKLILIILFIFSSAWKIWGQEVISDFRNSLKYEVFSSVYGDYSLTYERSVGKKTSLNVDIGYLRFHEFNAEVEDLYFEQINRGVSSFLEYRFYLNKKYEGQQKGVYLGPYIRYSSFAFGEFVLSGTPLSIKQTFSLAGIGLQFGIQKSMEKLIHSNTTIGEQLKRIVFDFHIIGGGVDVYTVKFALNGISPEDFKNGNYSDEIAQSYAENPTLFYLTSLLLNDFTKTKESFFAPGIRAGFSLGYRF